MDKKRLQELAGIEQLNENIHSDRLDRKDRERDLDIKGVQKYVNDQDNIGEVIFDAIFEKAGPDIAHYFYIKRIELGFDHKAYEQEQDAKK